MLLPRVQQESHYKFSYILLSHPFGFLAGVIDPDYQEEVELMLHKRGEEEYVWHQGDSFECFLVPLYLVLMVNR